MSGEKPRPYRPANGTEGEYFMERWCYRCQQDAKFQETNDGEDGCPIIAATLVYDVDDPSYPAEWIRTGPEGGAGKCTAFEPIRKGA